MHAKPIRILVAAALLAPSAGRAADLADGQFIDTMRPFLSLATSVYGPANIATDSYTGVGATGAFQLGEVELELFLKKVTTWPSGAVVRVVEPGSAAVRDAFYRKVAGKSPSAVRSYWNQLIFSGREVPPIEKATDDDVVAYVRSEAHAVGYVSAAAPTPGVKTVALRD